MFDKTKLLQNIRFLALQNGVKIGELETEAGVSVGYISRMLKIEDSGSPSLMDLALLASEKFGVSLNGLVQTNLSEMLPNELYLAKFFSRLEKRTAEGLLAWTYESKQALLNVDTELYPQIYYRNYPDYCEKYFQSDFNINNYLGNGAASTQIGNRLLYIFQVEFSDKDNPIPKSGYEFYFVDEKPTCRTTPVLCVFENSRLFLIADKLFKSTLEACHQIKITQSTRETIDNFMLETEDLPF